MTPALQMFAVLTAVTLLQTGTSSNLKDTIFTLTVSSQLKGGERETLCVHIHNPTETFCLSVTLYVNSTSTLILEEEVEKDFYQCVDFQVPTVTRETVATILLDLDGEFSREKKETKVLIVPPSVIHIVQTDKPVYKPGQRVHFRVVSIDENFLPVKQVYKELLLEDPNSNCIAQWLDKTIAGGILDLSHDMIPEAMQGTYKIIAKTEEEEEIHHNFTLKEYVLPPFEVTVELPNLISLLDKEITLKICGKYTYGKPIIASVKADFCRKVRKYYHFLNSSSMDICQSYNLTTDKNGCATQAVNMEGFFPTKFLFHYYDSFEVSAEMEEKETGITVRGEGQTAFSAVIRRVSFVDLPEAYRPGLPYEGKAKLTGPGEKPVSNEELHLSTINGQNVTLTTDMQGIAAFSLDTSVWDGFVYLQVSCATFNESLFVTNGPSPRYYPSYHRVTEFYSPSSSFLQIMQVKGKIPCNQRTAVRVQYIIQGKELKEGQKVLNFFFLVMSRGGIKQHGSIPVSVEEGIVNKGEVSVPLHKVTILAPYAQVVVYTVLPNEETVADSINFPVQLCLNNKVSLKFSSVKHLPADKTTLTLKAHPGSLCSVRAIDKSVLLLEPEKELTVDHVFSMLPQQRLRGYATEVQDPDPYPCIFDTPSMTQPSVSSKPVSTMSRDWNFGYTSYFTYKPPKNKDDSYNMFQEIGVKILTNSDVTKPYKCLIQNDDWYPTLVAFETIRPTHPNSPIWREEAQMKVKKPARTVFAETWIWDLIPLGESGSAKVEKTVPDTITKWVGGAVCVSSVGLGISPNIGLTTFKPFFVSLTLPYSAIRGEVLTLKATVFNYLSKCIMISVKLAKSDEFTFRNCDGCQYSRCLCAGESKTFSWMVTPTALGQMDLRVSAEVLKTKARCGKEVPIVPDKGKIDTVVRKLLVEAEGTPKMEARNALLCPQGKSVETNFSLVLPEKFVEGSARASVSVLGDLIGRALKNLDNLLQMPYGCGEQNMLRFAPNIYILDYLKSTNQLTEEIQNKATALLESGYQRELLFKHSNGSYSAFGPKFGSGNTWLTSFVMKSFVQAKTYIFVDDKHITAARMWLSTHQQKDGCIKPVGKLFSNAMKGGVRDEVSLTAYITAALLEVDPKKDNLVKRCLKCLKTAVSGPMDNLYTTALMSYAFTLAGDEEMRSKLITQLNQKSITEGVSRHWERSNPENRDTPLRFSWSRPVSVDVEITSYVLLALLSGPSLPGYDTSYSAGIVRWLIQQQNLYGGFSSTQDTVVALQALAKYAAATYSKESKTTVTVGTAGGLRKQFTVDQTNRLLYQEGSLSEVSGLYTVQTKGKSCVLVQITLQYNVPSPLYLSTFNISTNTQAQCNTTNSLISLFVQVSYNGNREETNMAIINIKLLSGHVVDEKSLNLLKRSSSVRRVEEEDGHINIYLDGLQKSESKIYNINQIQHQPVGNLKPAVVKIYDYYQTNDEAVTDYTSPCAKQLDLV